MSLNEFKKDYQLGYRAGVNDNKQRVKEAINKYHGGIHPKCNMCRILEELGFDKEGEER